MKPAQYVASLMLGVYGTVPFIAASLAVGTTRATESLALDVALATLPLLLLAAVSWRLVWPRWKLFGKLLVHPCIYLVLSK